MDEGMIVLLERQEAENAAAAAAAAAQSSKKRRKNEKMEKKVCKRCGHTIFFNGINGGVFCEQCLLEFKEENKKWT